MQENAVHIRRYHVGVNDADFARQLKLSALFNYCQESATTGAEALGIGMSFMEAEYGAAWILSRVRADLVCPPVWGETISVETWPQPPGRLEFERDYLVRNQQGLVLGKAISGGILMDTKKRRILRPSVLKVPLPLVDRPRPIEEQGGRLQPKEDLADVYSRIISYSDVDIHGHLNNTKYVDFIMDCFSIECHRQYRVASLDVNFVNEALPGDVIILRKEITPPCSRQHYIEGVRQNDGRAAFRAQVSFVDR